MALIANEVDFAMMSAFLMIPVSVQNRDVTMLGGFSRYAQRNPAEFIDSHPLTEIDRSGYVDRLYAAQEAKGK